MRKHRYIQWIMCALLVCALCMLGGCQLAREDEEAVSQDRFAGISVHLLTDFAFNYSGGEDYVDRSIPHEADGRNFYLEISQTETGETVHGLSADDCFTDLAKLFKMVNTEEEQSEEVQLEATMYVCPAEFEGTPYLTLEHIYLREDGTLYAVDCGSNYGGSIDGLSITLKEDHTFLDTSGNIVQSAMQVKLNVKARMKVEKVRLLAMSGTNSVGEFIIGNEEEVWLLPDTEWVLMEETLSDGSVQRTAFNRPLDGTVIKLFTECEDGIFIPQRITLRTAGGR